MRSNRVEFCAGFAVAVVIGGIAIALLGPPPSQAMERPDIEQEVSLETGAAERALKAS